MNTSLSSKIVILLQSKKSNRKGTQGVYRVSKMAKERFMVCGKELTANEKAVFEFVRDNGVVDYKTVAEKLEISPKSASSTLARLQATHGLLTKNAPVAVTTYEISADENADAE